MYVPLFLAWRFIRGTKHKATLSTMMLVCFISILLSTCALTLVAAIMKGFERATYQKLQGIHSDLIIHSPHQALNYPAIVNVLNSEFHNAIAMHSSIKQTQVLLSAQQNTTGATQLVVIRAIDPAQEAQLSSLPQMIISPSTGNRAKEKMWRTLFRKNAIVIGKTLADNLGIKINDTVDLLYTQDELQRHKVAFDQERARVSGLFKTGIYELDEQVIFCSHSFIKQFLPDLEVNQVNIKLRPNINSTQEKQLKELLSERLRLVVQSWKDLYPALVSALALEKYAMIFILSLVALISSMNIIALLFMLIQHKQKHIAVLTALGMKTITIQQIFLMVSCLITTIAALLGIALAWLIGTILTTYKLIELPDIYYVQHLPIDISYNLVTLVFIFTVLLSLIATLIPVRSALTTDTPTLLQGID